ncbi:MMPL family transporter [Spirillospora sp. NPDC052269]
MVEHTRRITALPAGRVAKWIVLALWIALLVPAAMFAGKLGDVQKNDSSAWLPKNAEATKVLDRAAKFQPGDTLPTVVVYDRPGGVTPADIAKAKADATAFKGVRNVVPDVRGPIPSKDGKALQTFVKVETRSGGWAAATKAADQMIDIGRAGSNGLGMHVTGAGGYAADSSRIFTGGNSLLMITMLVVVAILLLTYRSPMLWLFPMITAGIALACSEAVVYLLAEHAGLTVNAQSSFILAVLVIGASTDYALLLIARYREELRRHGDRHAAMAEALRRSGPAIVASAATVAISLMVLMLATLNSTKGLGPPSARSASWSACSPWSP